MTRVATHDGDPPRVAYAVHRSAGNAVERNRIRRRLRAIVRAHEAALAPGHMYLISASAGAKKATSGQLHTTVRELIAQTAARS